MQYTCVFAKGRVVKMQQYSLRLKYLGIDTYKENIIYLRHDSPICRAEGFEAQARIQITFGKKIIIATLNTIESELLSTEEASLSKYAWTFLGTSPGDAIFLSHPKPLDSLSYIHAKVYNHELYSSQIESIINDVLVGDLSDIQIASFLTACAGGRLNTNEIVELTRAMVKTGDRLNWPFECVVDKHCVGGLPGNRTTLIVVPIVAAFGLTMPKTSSRAITSPAGTADTMEVLAPVELNISTMRKVVERENACIIWGGSVALSPADDILIRIEKVLDLDSEGQLVASVLSKKIAAGSTHVVIDMPIGMSAKVRSLKMATTLKQYLEEIGNRLGLKIRVIFTDGSQPVGYGVGPALEARDVLSVLQRKNDAPQDLRERALVLAGSVLEFSATIKLGQGKLIAKNILDSGLAWKKFQAICDAQGGMRDIPKSLYIYTVHSHKSGRIKNINNRTLAKIAKLAGAPQSKSAGVDLHVHLTDKVIKDDPLFTIHSETKGELEYALSFFQERQDVISCSEDSE